MFEKLIKIEMVHEYVIYTEEEKLSKKKKNSKRY